MIHAPKPILNGVDASPELQMPKACISCQNYTAKGYDRDAHCPFNDKFSRKPKERTQFGLCGFHKVEVFATEICNSYQVEPFVDPVPVTNRPESRSGIQEKLKLVEVA
ncbi:hypothetical protein [Marinobacter sp. F4218]|uniref:hypothetical protein n=1 Tax=Marinobacter sp. F4218 TaxID=2862868 RepID=UPI001C62789A|nr:hypothetical protein [Marinobacter sp. F4218]MBW7472319.1 hypothetical protein [Marinobacter sp. F4218]